MSVWNSKFLNDFTDEQRKSTHIGNCGFWGAVCGVKCEVLSAHNSICSGLAFTKEAYRFLNATKKSMSHTNVIERNRATVVEFRGFKIHVLDWVALVEGVTDGNCVHFYGSSKNYHRVHIDRNFPFILNKENVLNHALFDVAAQAAKREGRRVRDVDYEGLVKPELLTELFQPMQLSTENDFEIAKANNPIPELSFSHAT